MPTDPDSKPRSQFNLRVPEGFSQTLRQAATREGVPVSEFARRAIQDRLLAALDAACPPLASMTPGRPSKSRRLSA